MAERTDFEHELKNYMAIIIGYADLLLEGLPAGDPRYEDMREIHKAAEAAIALINTRTGSST